MLRLPIRNTCPGQRLPAAGAERPPPAVVVVECKVAPDHPVNIAKQIQDYRVHLNSGTFGRSRKTVILLSPYADKHGADSHLSWSEVSDALCAAIHDHKSGDERRVLQQFDRFLKLRRLAKMKLPSVDSLLPSLKKAGPLIAGLDTVLARLGNDEETKTLFRGRAGADDVL